MCSNKPMHSKLSWTKPCRHSHIKDPAVLTHCCRSLHVFGFCLHSSMSNSHKSPVYPGLHTHALTLSQVSVPSSQHSHLFLQSGPHQPNSHSTILFNMKNKIKYEKNQQLTQKCIMPIQMCTDFITNINWRVQIKNVVNNVDVSSLRAQWQNGPYKN